MCNILEYENPCVSFSYSKNMTHSEVFRKAISSNINILFVKNVLLLLLIPAAPSFLKPSFLKQQCLCVTLILVFAVEELGKKCLEYLGHLSIIRDEMVNYTGANVQTKNQDRFKFKVESAIITTYTKIKNFGSKKFET